MICNKYCDNLVTIKTRQLKQWSIILFKKSFWWYNEEKKKKNAHNMSTVYN